MTKTDRISVGFVGDIYLGKQPAQVEVASQLSDQLAKCDAVVANLEGPITNANQPIAKWGPVMRQPEEVGRLLHDLHVTHAALANNHICDHKREGLRHTIEFLERRKIACVGAHHQSVDSAFAPVELLVGGRKIALFNVAENGAGCLTDYSPSTWGFAWVFHPKFHDKLEESISKGDLCVVCVHAGLELIDHPLPEWREIYRSWIDKGAVAVVGHHPHVTQGVEVYKDRPIFYSIGNFFFNADRPTKLWYHSQAPILTFDANGGLDYEIIHCCFTAGEGATIDLDTSPMARERPEKLSAELGSECYEALLEEDLQKLWRSHYGPWFSLSIAPFQSVRSFARALREMMLGVLGRGFWKRRPRLLENILVSESHRWAILRSLKKR